MCKAILAVVFAIILFIPIHAKASTPCTEWADFSKIITVRFRADHDAQEVKAELYRSMHGHPELPLAFDWIDFIYAHMELDPTAIWMAVFKECDKGSF